MSLDDALPPEARPWGSTAHLEWRKQMRLEKKMNRALGKKKPLLKSLPPSLRILRHELDCDCLECQPQHVKDFLKTTEIGRREEAKQSHGIESAKPMTPTHSQRAKKGFPVPKKKWDDRCNYCSGTGVTFSIKGERIDCPRCSA